jgi:hypothetical protein
MDGSKIERGAFSKKWHRKIGATLPVHLAGGVATTPTHRAAFAKSVEESIHRWETIKPEIAPEREKLKRLFAEADTLRAAIERVKARALKLATKPEIGTNSYTAEGDLYRAADRAAIELDTWDKRWPRPQGRPPIFDAQLTKRLQDDYRLFCGHVRGFDGLLTVILAMRVEYPADFPELHSSTLAKRKQRAQ